MRWLPRDTRPLRQNKEALLKLAVDDQTWNAYIANRLAKRRDVPVPQFVEVQGSSKMLNSEMQAALEHNAGHPVDYPDLQTDITKIVGAGRFSSLSYRMTEKGTEPGLLITATEKSYAPPLVRPLIVIDGAQYNNVLFSAGARITFLDFGSYGAELRNDIILGSIYQVSSEYYRPLTPKTKWFIAPKVAFNSNTFNVYSDQKLLAQYRQRVLGGTIDGGYAISAAQQIRFGYSTAYERYSSQIGEVPDYPNVSGRTGNSHVNYLEDATNDAILPTRGSSVQFRIEYYDANPAATEKFPLSQLTIHYFQPVSPEVLRISWSFRWHDFRRSRYRRSVLLTWRTQGTGGLWPERISDESVLLLSGRRNCRNRKAATTPGKQHQLHLVLRNCKALLHQGEHELSPYGRSCRYRPQDNPGSH